MKLLKETVTSTGVDREMVMSRSELFNRYEIEPPPAKPGTCGTCKHWTPPTPLNHLGGCHNMIATLGAHLPSRRESRCNYHETPGGDE